MAAAAWLFGAIVTAISFAAMAQDAPPAMDPYQHAQELRQRADALAAEDPTPEKLAQAARYLQEALDFLATRDVRERAEGNMYLYARRADVLRDLAGTDALMGKREEALGMLELMNQEAWSPGVAKWLREDQRLASLQDEPRFKAVLRTLEVAGRLWKGPHIATAFKDRLSVEERIAGLSLFWAEARESFVYFDHVADVDWDRVYLEYLPRVMAAQTTQEYYRVMMQLAPLLRDSHTNIYPPRELQPALYSRPPLRTERIGGKVYVTQVYSASLATRISPGEEVISIDGVGVEEYANANVAPFVSSSTPQDREVRMYQYQLLAGDADRPFAIALRGPDGVTRNEIVARKGYSDIARPSRFGFRMLPGDVAYLSIDDFESDAGVKAFEKALPEILGAKALVLDLRENGGGSGYFGFQILSYLVPGEIRTAKSRYRENPGFQRAFGARIAWKPVPGEEVVKIARGQRFAGPVALLVGPRTFSAAEDFVLAFDVAKRGILVGSATAGSTGQPLMFALPGGGSARICVKRDAYPDGREFVGRGIEPDIPVSVTAADVRAQRDPVLDRAAAALLKAR